MCWTRTSSGRGRFSEGRQATQKGNDELAGDDVRPKEGELKTRKTPDKGNDEEEEVPQRVGKNEGVGGMRKIGDPRFRLRCLLCLLTFQCESGFASPHLFLCVTSERHGAANRGLGRSPNRARAA